MECEVQTLTKKERKYVKDTLRRQQCRIFCLNNYEKRNTQHGIKTSSH